MATDKRPSRIQLPENIARDLEKHAYSNLDAEVGGMLFGGITNGKTQIVGFVPALKATSEQISLTFTHEVWEDILQQGESKFPGKQIVGWYHTHPSFGIFLSDYDQFIQNNFFNQPGQVALVIDPIAGSLGWFEKKGEKVVLLCEEPTLTGARKAKSTKPRSQGTARKTLFAVILTAMVTATATYGISVYSQAPNLSGALKAVKQQLEVSNAQINYLQEQLGFQQGILTLNYTVREGDTLESISDMFYGSQIGVQILLDSNPTIKANELTPGSNLLITNPNGINLAQIDGSPEEQEKK